MTDSSCSIFTGMQTLINHEWRKHLAVVIENGVIKAILQEDLIKHHLPAKIHTFPKDYYLVPGFIDLHIHGANGKDVMDGTVGALSVISRSLAAEGVTSFLATTMTAEANRIEAALTVIAQAMSEKHSGILGVHLEGPFISKEKMGAQHGDHAELPDVNLISRWQTLANNAIKLVTLAPELPGAKSLIQALHNMDVIVSIGHTNATYAETCAAIAAGCTQATHLFNAMRGIHQREPGAVCALLLSENINAELIVDGLHLHPAVVQLALRLKGKDKLLLVTDAMRAKCMGDGCYELGGQTVEVKAEKATLKDGTLAGSVLSIPQAIKNMLQFTQCSLLDAINMATVNPARVLKISNRKGTIEVGKDADLVVMTSDLHPVMTMREGMVIYEQ